MAITRTILIVAMLIGVLTLPRTLVGQVQSPLFGTWKLNLAKSTGSPDSPLFKRSTCTIEPWEDGVRVTYEMVGVRGGITHLEWSGKFDGRDHAVQGVDYVLTNAYHRVDDHTYEVVQKVDGEVAATARIVISPDGKTITTVTLGKNAQGQNVTTTTVYDKQ